LGPWDERTEGVRPGKGGRGGHRGARSFRNVRATGRDSVVSHSEDRTEDTTPTAHTNGGSPVMQGKGREEREGRDWGWQRGEP